MATTPPDLTLRTAVDNATRIAILRAWRLHTGNLTQAAGTLGLSSRHLRREVDRLALWPALDACGYERQAGPARGGAVALPVGGQDS